MKYDDLVRSILQKQKDTVLYKKGIMSDTGHAVLGVAGLIPGVGEVFDLANTLWYLRDKEYLNAALSLISCIPIIGDILGKGTMMSNFLAKLARYLRTTGSMGRGGVSGISGVRRSIVKVSPVIVNLKNNLKDRRNQLYIKALFNRARQHKDLQPHVDKMVEALNIFLKT